MKMNSRARGGTDIAGLTPEGQPGMFLIDSASGFHYRIFNEILELSIMIGS
jgi:hypothetical protein